MNVVSVVKICPECGDNHVRALANLSATGEIKRSVAQCANGHQWELFTELKSDEISGKIERTDKENDE